MNNEQIPENNESHHHFSNKKQEIVLDRYEIE